MLKTLLTLHIQGAIVGSISSILRDRYRRAARPAFSRSPSAEELCVARLYRMRAGCLVYPERAPEPCARISAGLLAQTGLERLVSETPDEYVATAVELAQDLDRLRALRAGMRERMRVSSLMDERGFARRFAAALRDMWREWCKTGP